MAYSKPFKRRHIDPLTSKERLRIEQKRNHSGEPMIIGSLKWHAPRTPGGKPYYEGKMVFWQYVVNITVEMNANKLTEDAPDYHIIARGRKRIPLKYGRDL